jgi:preprotein translocase subunit SecD
VPDEVKARGVTLTENGRAKVGGHCAARREDAMTMNERAKTTGLIVAFILASAALSAIAASRAPTPDDAQEVDKIRAAIAANAEKALEKQGGSRILFKVDAGALHEAMVPDLRDDAYRILREGHIPFAGLAVREGGVEVRIAEAKDQRRVLSKLVPSTEATPSRGGTVGVADSGDGLIRFMPTDSGFAERLHGLVRQSME